MKFTSKQFVFGISLLLAISINSNLALAETDSSKSQAMWKELPDQSQAFQQLAAKNVNQPINAKFLELNEVGLKALLNTIDSNSSLSARGISNASSNKTISLPLPDGSQVTLNVSPSAVMSDALALQFPEIKTWKVNGTTKDISGVIDFTDLGFHAMLKMSDGDTVFIEPNKINDSDLASKQLSESGQYLSLSKRANTDSFKTEFSCGVNSDSSFNFSPASRGFTGNSNKLSAKLQARPAADLITYRLAVATTGEYTQYHGGTVSKGLSAVVTTINRVNEIFERDFSITFQLVDEQSELIYLDPDTDPYTNSDTLSLLSENAQNLSSNGVLNTSQYDIGHVLGAGGDGGLAQVGSVCNTAFKAQGATTSRNPITDSFDLDYVAHELGHQVGGSHTFNSSCGGNGQRSAITAVEPGSGTTIMSYAGLCGSDNITDFVDDYFHVVSIAQIRGFTREDDGSECGVLSNTGNESPSVNAGNDFTVPARTPLVFIGSGEDVDGDTVSYTWEQSDSGSSSGIDIDTGDNALFRSRPATNSAVRFIPRLSDIFNQTTAKGELLPVTNRSIEMVLTARDGKGGLEYDIVNMDVHDTGESFSVTSHTSNQTITRGSEQTVRWDVAGTNSSPISCATVNIGLALEDAQGLDIASGANDGEQQITIPDDAPDMSDARFIVSCESSGFYNLSHGRISVGDENLISDDDDSSNGGGGGSIDSFMLSLFALLLWRRRATL